MSSLVLALIPARGGSKSIPRKNLLPLGGKPLIAYSIEDALKCKAITRTLVSTDDPEIAEISRGLGAEVPFLRPVELARDDTPDLPVFEHALRWLERQEGFRPELAVHLRPTHPVRSVATLEAAVERLRAHPEADSLRSVSWPAQTPYKMWRVEEGFLKPLLRLDGVPEPYSQPRQRLPEVFWQNGYVDVIRSRTILEDRSMAGRRILAFPLEEPFVEIDYPDSVEQAERLLAKRREGRLGCQAVPAPRHPS